MVKGFEKKCNGIEKACQVERELDKIRGTKIIPGKIKGIQNFPIKHYMIIFLIERFCFAVSSRVVDSKIKINEGVLYLMQINIYIYIAVKTHF